VQRVRMKSRMKSLVLALSALAFLGGCTTNPITGRGQIVSVPAAQAHAEIGFALSSGAQRLASAEPCSDICRAQDSRFVAQVERLGVQLETAARGMSPDLFERIQAFQVGVDPALGIATGSSASGRIALGQGIGRLDPADEVTAFLIAREMAHVIARHDEENSGARIVFSALTTLLPFTLIARIVASTIGSGALMGSWAEEQRREADEIAVALLVRTGRSTNQIASALKDGLKKGEIPEGDWSTRFDESVARVAAAAASGPKVAEFDEWLLEQSMRSIERYSNCARSGASGDNLEAALARRRECTGSA
jgi:hypothetical protein